MNAKNKLPYWIGKTRDTFAVDVVIDGYKMNIVEIRDTRPEGRIKHRYAATVIFDMEPEK